MVQASEAQAFADKNGCSFMETSAKLKKNIDEAFYQVVRLVRDGNGSALNVNKAPKKSKCSIL
ncbi:Ras family protein [compost metagenome]